MTNECFISGVQYKCRTCFDPATTVYPLADGCTSSRTWKDLLNDIVHLKINDEELLPKTICSKCLEKLSSYYDFILHIRNVNEKYHQLLESAKNSQNDGLASSSNNTECLAEFATALPLDQYVPKIKDEFIEGEFVMSYDVLNSDNRRNDLGKEDTFGPYVEHLKEDMELSSDNLQYQQRSPNEEINQVLGDDVKVYDSENSSTSTADESDYLIEKIKNKDEMNKSGSASYNASEHDLVTSQPFGKRTEEEFCKYEYFPIEKVDNNFVCGICNKSYTLNRNCRRHIFTMHYQGKLYKCAYCDQHAQCQNYLIGHLKRKHPDESFESNATQLGRLFGERLYSKPLLLPRVECKLCCTTFVTKKKLLQHLESHSEDSTLDSLQLSSDVIKRWFPNKRNLQVIKAMICKDIREKNLVKYYTILNDFSYEISISDTDLEDLEEEKEAPAIKYKCELCAKDFLYKYQAFAHFRENHLNEEIPSKCIYCNLEFISIKMYEQHKQTHCLNEHKLLLCPNCNGKFVWLENIRKHDCVTKILDIEKPRKVKIRKRYNDEMRSSPKTIIIRCGLCEMTFEKLRDLRQHMPLHADGKTGVDFNDCIYVNQFENVSSNRELLEQKIKNAFTKREISQLYQATDKDGKEMDILDSDNDEGDAGNDNRINYAVKEDTRDRFMETMEEDIELALDTWKYEQRSQNEENRVLGDDVNNYNSDNRSSNEEINQFLGDDNDYDSENSSTTDESDHMFEKRKKEGEVNKSGQRFDKKKNDNRDKVYEQIEKVHGNFVCAVCKKSFTMQKLCRRHILVTHRQRQLFQCQFCDSTYRDKSNLITHIARVHPGESFESNEKQLGRLFGERLYSKPLLLPRVECKLCGSILTSKKTLLQHLDSHSEASTLHSLKLSSDVIQRWFSNMSDLQDIKTTICKDIREKNLFKYYTILNDFSYEISISDTDAEDLEEETEAPANKYNCELCAKDFLYKYQVFAHLREDHLNEDIPWKCSHCNLKFISIKMYEQHNQTHCQNEHKLLLCANCNGKFLWLENMKKHNCVTKILYVEQFLKDKISVKCNEVIRSSPKSIIRCGLCEMTFEKLRDLRQHMPLHADGKTGVDFDGCFYVNQFENCNNNRELLQQIIRNAFTKRQISQLYQAIDKDGKEMDISDSDSDEGDADGEKSYLCELCYETFKKRKLLFNHQKEQHQDVSMPFTCKECKMQYVSIDLLQQHLKRECWNEDRREAEQCDCCKERFIWPENMLRHKEIQRYIRIKNSLPTNFCRDNIQICYCFLCPKNFSNADLLNDHLMRHRLTPSIIKTVASTIHSTWWPNGKKIIKCKICNRAFLSMAALNEHFSLKNPKNLCGAKQHYLENYSITNQMGFELHLELDSETETEENENILPYTCCLCSKSFKRKFQITQHQRSMHNYELLELKCERCVFRTVSQKVLDYHRMSQCFDVEKQYQCDQCNFKFMWQENLKNHVSIFHNSNVLFKTLDKASSNDLSLQQNYLDERDRIQFVDKFQCIICGIYIIKNHYSEHISRHKYGKSYNCSLCEMVFLTPLGLAKHRSMSHKILYNDERPYRCTICSKFYRRWGQLSLHMQRHADGKLKTQNNLSTPDKKKFKVCPICGVHRTNIETHIRIHTEETKFKCDLCDKILSNEVSLYVHRRTHFNKRSFKCTLCEKAYFHKYQLNDHMRSHTGERPFQCTVCDKRFTYSRSLIRHSLSHTGNS